MRFGTFVLPAILSATLGACGQSDTTTPVEANEAAANEVAPGNEAAVAPSGTQAFVDKVAAGDRFEIETSRLVAGSAASPEVMDYARQLIAAHTQSTARLKAAAAKDSMGLVIDDRLSTAQQAALEDMKSKKGYIFDTAYLSAQVHGHGQMLTELKDYAASGDNASLKTFAQDQIPTVTEHVDKAKALQGRIGPAAR
jgi:putative membrane protein